MSVEHRLNVLEQQALKERRRAPRAPEATDDSTYGYRPAYVWEDITTGTVYECVDATPGAAVWHITYASYIEPRTSDPVNPIIGRIWLRTDL